MASLNKVILLGNLTKDPELKRAPSGVAIAKLRLAVSEQFRDRATGQPKEVVCYVDVAVWDRQAETCAQYLQKGSQIMVEGRLIYDEWKTPSGETRSRLAVRADRIQFLAGTKGRQGGDGQSQTIQRGVPGTGGAMTQMVQRGIPETEATMSPQPPESAAFPSAPAAYAPPSQAPSAAPVNDDDENLPF